MDRNEKKDSRKTVWLLILIVFLVLAIGLSVLLLVLKQFRNGKSGQQNSLPDPNAPGNSYSTIWKMRIMTETIRL